MMVHNSVVWVRCITVTCSHSQSCFDYFILIAIETLFASFSFYLLTVGIRLPSFHIGWLLTQMLGSQSVFMHHLY